jgi:hypothetical protein
LIRASLREKTVKLSRDSEVPSPAHVTSRGTFSCYSLLIQLLRFGATYALYATDPALLFDAAEIVDVHRFDRTCDYRAAGGLQPSHAAASAHRLP